MSNCWWDVGQWAAALLAGSCPTGGKWLHCIDAYIYTECYLSPGVLSSFQFSPSSHCERTDLPVGCGSQLSVGLHYNKSSTHWSLIKGRKDFLHYNNYTRKCKSPVQKSEMWSKSFWEVQAWIDNDDYEKKITRLHWNTCRKMKFLKAILPFSPENTVLHT